MSDRAARSEPTSPLWGRGTRQQTIQSPTYTSTPLSSCLPGRDPAPAAPPYPYAAPHHHLALTPRFLAQTWDETYLPPTHPLVQRKRRFDPMPSILNTINVFVLLDLLGHKSPRIASFYRETDWLFALMESADKRLRAEKLVEVEQGSPLL